MLICHLEKISAAEAAIRTAGGRCSRSIYGLLLAACEFGKMDDDDAYVMSSCTECRRRMRANRLTNVTQRVQSGGRRSSSNAVYIGRRPSSRSSNGSSYYYKNITKRMCEDCYDDYARQEAERLERELAYQAGERRKKIILSIFVVVAIISWRVYAMYLAPVTNKSVAHQNRSISVPSSNPPAQFDAYSRLTNMPVQTISPPSPPTDAYTPPPAPLPLPEPSQPIPPPEDYYTVNYLANVRSSPNNGSVIGVARAGEELSIVETKGLWAQVRRGDQIIGWVHRSLLTPSR